VVRLSQPRSSSGHVDMRAWEAHVVHQERLAVEAGLLDAVAQGVSKGEFDSLRGN